MESVISYIPVVFYAVVLFYLISLIAFVFYQVIMGLFSSTKCPTVQKR